MAFREATRRATVDGDNPDDLLDSGGIAARVGILATHFKIATADVYKRAGVGRPLDLVDLLAVVFGVRGDLAAAIIRGRGGPQVPCATRIELPRDLAAAR